MAETTINTNVHDGKSDNEELRKAYEAADNVLSRLFFLQEIAFNLSSPEIGKIELSYNAMIGLSVILQDMANRAMDVTENLSENI